MKFTNYLSVATLMGMFTFGVSCTKDDSVIEKNDNEITLTVPAMPGFGDNSHSRTIFEDNGTKPIVNWQVGDPIYIGSTRSETEDLKKTLEDLTEEYKFTVFTCESVSEDGTATFKGKSLPENADIAIYTKHPEQVKKVFANSKVAFEAPCTIVHPKSDNNLEHLGENDLLVATFNSETKTFQMGYGSYGNKAFGRVFGLGKFVLNLPEGTTGNLGEFKCLSPGSGNTATGKLSSKGRVNIYSLHGTTGLPGLWGISGDFIVDCSNLTIQENQVVFYSLMGILSNFKDKILNFSLSVGGEEYIASLKAGGSPSQNSAIIFNLNFEKKTE